MATSPVLTAMDTFLLENLDNRVNANTYHLKDLIRADILILNEDYIYHRRN